MEEHNGETIIGSSQEHQLSLPGQITLNHKLECRKRFLSSGAEDKLLVFLYAGCARRQKNYARIITFQMMRNSGVLLSHKGVSPQLQVLSSQGFL